MKKNFYRHEYSNEGWKALVDEAEELGCEMAYNKYGSILTIDSTKFEDRLINGRENYRLTWAEAIYDRLEGEARKAGGIIYYQGKPIVDEKVPPLFVQAKKA